MKFANTKKSAIVVKTELLDTLSNFRKVDEDFFTFSQGNLNLWGRVKPSEVYLTNEQASKLKRLPKGVEVVSRQRGAVTQKVLVGPNKKVAKVLERL